METPLNITMEMLLTYPVSNEPFLVMPPGPVIRAAHDFECNDPRAYTEKAYVPRVYETKYTIPEAFKLVRAESKVMDYDWALMWRDLMGMYAPAIWRYIQPNLNDGNDWTWLNGFVPATELDKWYLHMIHGARAYTNKTGPNNQGYYDPVTGYGTPSNGEVRPYRKEGVTTGGNYFWYAGRHNNDYAVWCLDGFAPAPKAEALKDLFFLVHISTQCTPKCVSPTPRPEIDCPNGIWEITEFPQCGDNIVPVPLISCWEDAPTMQWNGLNLRQNILPSERYKSWPPPSGITYPYIPNKKMRPNP